jgi:diguanylate cyclase (GGDEF)-like protein/PAS domain S-box-containing protein
VAAVFGVARRCQRGAMSGRRRANRRARDAFGVVDCNHRMSREAVSVGLLHSQTGPTSSIEKHLVSAAVFAIEEINHNGGILGRSIRAVAHDGMSDPKFFADRAERLITTDDVPVIFGCWSSSSRKAVRPLVEQHSSLLIYPGQHEGMEESPNILYTGPCLNQQLEPGLSWAASQGAKRVALVGTDSVYSRVANGVAHSLADAAGIAIVGEDYVSTDGGEIASLVSDYRSQSIDMIVSTLEGDGSRELCTELASSNAVIPVLFFCCSEIELAGFGGAADGHYACWGYFSSIDTEENRRFLTRYRKRFGEPAPLADPIVTAYTQVHLWKEIVEKAGSLDPVEVRAAAVSVALDGPLGRLEVTPNGHVRRPVLVGRSGSDGLFQVVWQSDGGIEPRPWLGLDDFPVAERTPVREMMRRYSEALNDNCELHHELGQRSRVEEVLQERALRLAQMSQAVENSPVSVVITDIQGKITYVNPQFTQLTGYSADEAMGQNPRIIKSGQTPPAVYEELWSTILAGDVWRGEFLNRKRGGELYWELAVIAPLLDTEGRVLNFIAVKVDITQRKRAEEALTEANEQLEQHVEEIEALQAQLREQAIRDPLTTLYNRRFMEETLQREFHAAARQKNTLSVILVDIDHFKEINDKFGHRAGDEYLIQLAGVLQSQVRRSDIVCRLGGEEFLLILPDCEPDSTQTLAENIRRIVEKTWLLFGGDEINTTISLGVVSCPAGRGNCHEIIERADEAMYASKRAGRNRVTVHDDGTGAPS